MNSLHENCEEDISDFSIDSKGKIEIMKIFRIALIVVRFIVVMNINYKKRDKKEIKNIKRVNIPNIINKPKKRIFFLVTIFFIIS